MVSVLREVIFQPVQSLEKPGYVLIVRGLRAGESGLVHAVVDCVVHPSVKRVNFSP